MSLARLFADHKGGDVLVLDLAAESGWTDFSVLATATSSAHLRGLARYADEWAVTNKVQRLNAPRIADDEEWVLIDLGDVVVHLMTERARAFYELEKLWFKAQSIRVEAPLPPGGLSGGAPREGA